MAIGCASLLSLPPARIVRTGVVRKGLAGWCGAELHGRLTTSGERFDMYYSHTAAHADLPLGTWLLVAHAGRELMVCVNDRRPLGERFLELTWAGAAALGVEDAAEVEAEVCVTGL